jgi:WD repeat-containing protein 55
LQCDDELLSVALLKGGSTVVTGTQEGVLQVWEWGKWLWGDDDEEEDGPEHFTGHPSSIDAVLAVDDDAVVTGSSDGIIRLLTVHPNKLVGIIGEHGDGGLPVERLAWSRDKRVLASASHDNTVKLWDVAYLFEDDDDGGDDDGDGAGKAAVPAGDKLVGPSTRRGRFVDLPAIAMSGAAGGGGLDDDDDDDEDDDEEEEEFDEGEGGAAASGGGRGADMDDDSDDDRAAGRRRGARGGRGGAKPAKGGRGGFYSDL